VAARSLASVIGPAGEMYRLSGRMTLDLETSLVKLR